MHSTLLLSISYLVPTSTTLHPHHSVSAWYLSHRWICSTKTPKEKLTRQAEIGASSCLRLGYTDVWRTSLQTIHIFTLYIYIWYAEMLYCWCISVPCKHVNFIWFIWIKTCCSRLHIFLTLQCLKGTSQRFDHVISCLFQSQCRIQIQITVNHPHPPTRYLHFPSDSSERLGQPTSGIKTVPSLCISFHGSHVHQRSPQFQKWSIQINQPIFQSRYGVVKPQLIFHCDGFQHLGPPSSMSPIWYQHVWTNWCWMSPCWQEILFFSALILHSLRKPAKSCNSHVISRDQV